MAYTAILKSTGHLPQQLVTRKIPFYFYFFKGIDFRVADYQKKNKCFSHVKIAILRFVLKSLSVKLL